MKRCFIFGLGYCAMRIAGRLEGLGWELVSTGKAGTLSFDDEGNVRLALADSSHVISSVPPGGEGADPVLERYGHDIDRAAMAGAWLGYLSSTGVYGDTGGAWVDESAPIGIGRRSARAACDVAWLERGARVFRLPGIYGPDRNALERVRDGTARRIALPGQVFSRVHVDDLVSGIIAALDAPPGAYNLADDCPAANNDVIDEACRLLGTAPPPMQSLDGAGLSETARGFYSENRRVANGKAKRLLDWKPQFPTYREGLRGLLSSNR